MTEMAKIKGQRVMVSGTEALLRFPVLQRQLDISAGHNTAGFISGYRGSPLGGYDQLLWRKADILDSNDITFQPGLNEDLAATAVWGTQIAESYGPTYNDGIFGIWYGKGPGVDRTADVFRHANMQGTTARGGVVAIAGDDHAAQSSVLPHQSDSIFQSTFIPVFQPSSVHEVISMGLSALALSRYSGLWTAMKTVSEVIESAAVIDEASLIPSSIIPEVELPPHGLNWDRHLSLLEGRFEIERRLIEERIPAAHAWIAANRVNQVIWPAAHPKICIVTTGKAYQDVMQALSDLGISEVEAGRLGIGIFKYGISWPLSTEALHRFFPACPEFLVVEEKQPIIETQLKAAFFNKSAYRSSIVVGKYDEKGGRLLKETGELTPVEVAGAILARFTCLEEREDNADIMFKARARFEMMRAKVIKTAPDTPLRKPFFCAGCPHNSSLKVPEGAVASGGIGCHVMALSQEKFNTDVLCHMGGEGMQWVGAQAFSQRSHVFQNLGDGTYQHSGLLAIRAAIAADTPITFKILYNDAVAMTGGQAAEGNMDPARITRQLQAEGISKIALISDQAHRWHKAKDLAPGTIINGREELKTIQRAFSQYEGVSAIIYEQTCAAEKRRRRKRKTLPDPDKRLFINDRVCEGCGDCAVQSNCIAIEPLKTPFGDKRQINQSSCNKDLSCASGFCPSFIEVVGARKRTPPQEAITDIEAAAFSNLLSPKPVSVTGCYDIFVAGIGGTGILTLGAMMGAAAQIDGLYASVLDFTGLAQKNGTVVSHIRFTQHEDAVHAVRIPDGHANLLIAADYVAAASPANIRKMMRGKTKAVLNTHAAPTMDYVQQRDFKIDPGAVLKTLRQVVSVREYNETNFTKLAEEIFGETIAVNMMMMGFAYQSGWLPLSAISVERAIKDKGIAVDMNIRAFKWGRVCAEDISILTDILNGKKERDREYETVFDRNRREVKNYQNKAYADLYEKVVIETHEASKSFGEAGHKYYKAVEKYAFKIMLYKDEYEVARLYSAPDYRAHLDMAFSSWRSINIWLAPPSFFFSKKDENGRPIKKKFGPWIMPFFRVLKQFKFLRGGMFDPFGYSKERRYERQLVKDYLSLVRHLNENLTTDNIDLAIEIAALPDDIRGFGPVKLEAMGRYEKALLKLMTDFSGEGVSRRDKVRLAG